MTLGLLIYEYSLSAKNCLILFLNGDVTDIPRYISFRFTTQWSDICVPYEMVSTMSLVVSD